MDERTKRIEELFRLGVVVARAERPDFLKRHCGGDASLESELAALLAQDDDGTKSYLSSPVISRWRKGDTSRAEDPRAAALLGTTLVSRPLKRVLPVLSVSSRCWSSIRTIGSKRARRCATHGS